MVIKTADVLWTDPMRDEEQEEPPHREPWPLLDHWTTPLDSIPVKIGRGSSVTHEARIHQSSAWRYRHRNQHHLNTHKYWGLLLHQLMTGPKMAGNYKSNTTRTKHPWLLVLRVNIKHTFLFALVASQWTSILQSPHHGKVSISLMFTPLGFLHLLYACKRAVACHCWLETEQEKYKWVTAKASLDTAVYIRLWQ